MTPIPLIHAHFNVLGFRIGDVAYCTDVNKIPKESWPRLEGLRVLVLDALRHKPHPGHFSLDEAVEVVAAPAAAEGVFHAHVARPRARGDQPPVAAEHGAGVRRPKL